MKKSQKRLIIWSIIISVLLMLLIIFSYLYLFTTKNVSYVYDKETGIVKIEVHELNFLEKLFKQETTFDPWGTVNVNTPVQLRSYYDISILSSPVYAMKIEIRKDYDIYGEPIIVTFNPQIQPGGYIQRDVSWTPTEAGTYMTKTYIRSLTGTWTEALNQGELVKENTLVVVNNNPIPTCNLTAHCTNWNLDSNIDNGMVEKRICYTISDSCTEVEDSTSYKTTCNSGYIVTGTQSSFSNTKGTCSLPTVVTEECTSNSDCTPPAVCYQSTSKCAAPACTEDATCSYSNGTIVVTGTCTDYTLVSTGNSCGATNQTNNTNSTVTPTPTPTPTSNNTVATLTCWKDSSIKQQAMTGSGTCDTITIYNKTSCSSAGYYVDKTTCESAIAPSNAWIFYVIGGGIIFLLIIFAIIIMRKKRR